ncbi:MAG TPA: bifunctional class I SAM-dependent methyltransferase/glycosyltransferase family 2 protein [Polyangiaceae bacterium]|nr:bifunctional class I SAM-dependent methyltransferase/glycosyltransferase family 2 protein [Polyangiaceae bacterium]
MTIESRVSTVVSVSPNSSQAPTASALCVSSVSSPSSRELERVQRRIRVYDSISEHRAHWLERAEYYHATIHRIVESLAPPGTRVLEIGCGLGDLLAHLQAHGCRCVGVDISPRAVEIAKARHPELDVRVADVERSELPEGPFDLIAFADVIGHVDDVQRAFERVRSLLSPQGRIFVTYYNFVWEPALKVAERLGLKTPWPEQNWLSMRDIENLLVLSGYQVVRTGTEVLVPFRIPYVSDNANRVGANLPLLREGALLSYFVARAVPVTRVSPLPSVSVICPCKNERGNIAEAIERTPVMGPRTELIFVDGNSTDGTVEEIEKRIARYSGPLELRLVRQGDGKGKGDAVRKGFAAAKNEVLMILDSDLTVPPEDLPKFYEALVTSKGELINGVRLVYPMEGEAMRFLNLLGNKFFSAALSWILQQPIKDSLCGTKVLYKRDYERIEQNRSFFGDFDPFGDFDLLFGAARLNLKIVDLPVRYRARTYGETKISRFTHGWLLLRMTLFGFKKLRMVG